MSSVKSETLSETTETPTDESNKQRRERPEIQKVEIEELENPENQNEFDQLLLRKIPSKSQYDKQDMNPESIKLSTFHSIYDGVVEDGRNDRLVLKNIQPKSKERGIYYVLPTLAEVVIPFPFQQGNEKIITLPVNDPRILIVLDRMRILGIPFDVSNKNVSSNVLTIRKFMTDLIKGVQKTFFIDTESLLKLFFQTDEANDLLNKTKPRLFNKTESELLDKTKTTSTKEPKRSSLQFDGEEDSKPLKEKEEFFFTEYQAGGNTTGAATDTPLSQNPKFFESLKSFIRKTIEEIRKDEKNLDDKKFEALKIILKNKEEGKNFAYIVDVEEKANKLRSVFLEYFQTELKSRETGERQNLLVEKEISEDEINRIADRFMAYIFDGAGEAIHNFVLPEIESFIMGCPNPFTEKRILSRNFALLEQGILEANKGKKDIFLPGTVIDPNTGKKLTRKIPPPAKLTLKLKIKGKEKSYPDILRNWTKEDRSKGLYYKEEEDPNNPSQKQLNLYYLCTYPEEMKFSWVPAEYKDIYENYGLIQHAYMNRDQFFQSYIKIQKMEKQRELSGMPQLEDVKKEISTSSFNSGSGEETGSETDTNEKMAPMTLDPYLIRVGNRLFRAETKQIELDWENQGFLDYGPEDRPTLREFINGKIKELGYDWWYVYPLVYLMYNLQPPRDRYALVDRNLHRFRFNNKDYVVMGGDTPMKYIRRALVQLFGENNDKKKLSSDAKQWIFCRNVMKAIRNSSALKLDPSLTADSEEIPTRYQDILKEIYKIDMENQDTAVPVNEFLSKLSEQPLEELNKQFRENDTSFGDRLMEILRISNANRVEATDIIRSKRFSS